MPLSIVGPRLLGRGAGCPSCGGQRTGSCVSRRLCSCAAGQSRSTAARTQPSGNCGYARVWIDQYPCFA